MWTRNTAFKQFERRMEAYSACTGVTNRTARRALELCARAGACATARRSIMIKDKIVRVKLK